MQETALLSDHSVLLRNKNKALRSIMPEDGNQDRFYVAVGNELLVYSALCPALSVYPATYYRLQHPYPRFADNRWATEDPPAPFNSIRASQIAGIDVVIACDDAGQVVIWWWIGGEEDNDIRWSLLTPAESGNSDNESTGTGNGPWNSAWSLAVYSSDNTAIIACGTNSHVIWLWDLMVSDEFLRDKTFPVGEDGRVATAVSSRRRLNGHLNNIPCVEISPCGKLLASTSIDGTVRLWCIGTGACVHIIDIGGEREDEADDADEIVSEDKWIWSVKFADRRLMPPEVAQMFSFSSVSASRRSSSADSDAGVANATGDIPAPPFDIPQALEQALGRYMLILTSRIDFYLVPDLLVSCRLGSTTFANGLLHLPDVIDKTAVRVDGDNGAPEHPLFADIFKHSSHRETPSLQQIALINRNFSLWNGHIIFNLPLMDPVSGNLFGWFLCDRVGKSSAVLLKTATASGLVKFTSNAVETIQGRWQNDKIEWETRSGSKVTTQPFRRVGMPPGVELQRITYELNQRFLPLIGLFSVFHGPRESESAHFNVYGVSLDGSITCLQLFSSDFVDRR